jgi:hypothetical protein
VNIGANVETVFGERRLTTVCAARGSNSMFWPAKEMGTAIPKGKPCL